MGELDCVAYTNTVEAGIPFEKPNHFDIVIGITNIGTPVNVEAFIQMMFRIRDCEKRILSLYYQKIFLVHQVMKIFVQNLQLSGLMICLQQ